MRTGTKIILGAALLALLLIAGKFFLSEASFSPANPSWDGVSSVMTGNMRPLYGFDRMPPDAGGNTLLIVGPSTNYTAEDASYVQSFLQQGGRVVVMDDFGTANDLLRNISAPITIEHTALCQDLDYYKKPSFPIVRKIGNSSLTVNVSQLVFNHPAPLQVTGDAEVLARTTIMGWLDVDGKGSVSGNETVRLLPADRPGRLRQRRAVRRRRRRPGDQRHAGPGRRRRAHGQRPAVRDGVPRRGPRAAGAAACLAVLYR